MESTTAGPKPAKSKARQLIDSTSEIKFGWVKVGLLLLVFAAAVSAGRHVWYRQAGDPILGIDINRAKAEAPTTEAAPPGFAFPPTKEAIAATQTPYVIESTIVQVVTATPTFEPPTPIVEYVYEQVPVEVTRIVEITSVPVPTVTPVPLAPGTVKVCAFVEGATGLYIGSRGVVSGGCESFAFGIGQTSIQVQINK